MQNWSWPPTPMRTGFEAMRIGSIIYFVPFFFVLNPALIGQGSAFEVITLFGFTVFGIMVISAGLQGHLFFVGSLDGNALGMPAQLNLAAAAVFVVGLGLAFMSRRKPVMA